MWNESFPPILDRYLFAQIRPASSASEESCSYSLETRCTHRGNSSTPAFLRPRSKILIYKVRRTQYVGTFGSGTPRLYRDLGYGLFLPEKKLAGGSSQQRGGKYNNDNNELDDEPLR